MAIQSFRCRETEALFRLQRTQRWRGIEAVALRKLRLMHAAVELQDLGVPPGNRLERLRGDRAGQYSIRINKQWRLCFAWTPQGPADVEIVDYHG